MGSIISAIQNRFLVERVCSVLLYLIVVVSTYALLRQAKSETRFSRVLNVCLLILTVMAFFYIPGESADLYRIRLRIHSMESWTIANFRLSLINSSSPGADVLYFLMSKTNIDGLLPALTCFVFFGNIFYIIKQERKLGRSGSIALASSFLYIMSQGLFLGVISGIRNSIAFALILRALYDDFALGKKHIFNYLLCIIAVSFHIAAAPIVAVYLFFSIYDYWKNRKKIMTFVSLLVFIIVVFWAFRPEFSLIDLIVDKAVVYTSGGVYSYFWEYIIVTISLLFLIVVLYKYRRESKYSLLRTMYIISSIIMVGVVLLFRNYTIYHRYGNFVMYLSLPIISNAIETSLKQNDHSLYMLINYGSFLVFFIACVRGDLCGYKFFLM